MPKRRKKAGKAGSWGRGIATALLLALVGFFGFSIYLGYRASGPPSRKRAERLTAVAKVAPEPRFPGIGAPTLILMNGCGRPGLGARVERWLRRQGFDVFETRNADRADYRRTLVVLRSGRRDAAAAVADRLREALGVGEMIEQRVEAPEADALLILGSDFPDTLPPH